MCSPRVANCNPFSETAEYIVQRQLQDCNTDLPYDWEGIGFLIKFEFRSIYIYQDLTWRIRNNKFDKYQKETDLKRTKIISIPIHNIINTNADALGQFF